MATTKAPKLAKIDLGSLGLPAADLAWLARTLAAGRLRPSPPAVPTAEAGRYGSTGRAFRAPEPGAARAYYVWRLLAFYLSPDPNHQGEPDAHARFIALPPADKAAELARLDGIARRILAAVPRAEWHAFNRRQALGAFNYPGPRLHD
jgi:hypothetical protein